MYCNSIDVVVDAYPEFKLSEDQIGGKQHKSFLTPMPVMARLLVVLHILFALCVSFFTLATRYFA